MIGFIILLIVALAVVVGYFVMRTTTRAVDGDVDALGQPGDGIPEVEAARRRRESGRAKRQRSGR